MFSKRRIALYIGVMLVLVVGILAMTSFVLADSNRKPEKLIGAWYIDLLPDGGTPGHALCTFFADGAVQEDETGTGVSSGHGIWVMDKQGKVRFTFAELWWNVENDAYTNKFVVSQALKYDTASDTWSGPFKATIYDADGGVVAEPTGTAKFTRIALLPAP